MASANDGGPAFGIMNLSEEDRRGLLDLAADKVREVLGDTSFILIACNLRHGMPSAAQLVTRMSEEQAKALILRSAKAIADGEDKTVYDPESAIALARKGSDQTNNQVVAPGGGGGM